MNQRPDLISDKVYYVIDCARPATSGAPQVGATSIGGGATASVASPVGIIIPVTLSTPNADGDAVHEVRSGQTLWQIAIAYVVKHDEIKSLNNLFDNNIYPGNQPLIKRGVLLPTTSPMATPTQEVTSTFTMLPTSTATQPSTSTPPVVSWPALTNNATIMKIVIGIIAVAVLGGGIFTWLGSVKKG